MIITEVCISSGGKELSVIDDSGEKYIISVFDAKKTGLYKYCEDEGLLPDDIDGDMVVFLAKKMSCINYATYLLEFSDKSKSALSRKLRMKGYETDVCEAALDVLEHNGIIDDEKLCRDKLMLLAQTKLFGEYRLKCELIKKGFSSGDIDRALADADIDFDGLLRELIEKLAKRKDISSQDELRLLKNKLSRYGYSYERISSVISEYYCIDE